MPGPTTSRGKYTLGSPASKKRARRLVVTNTGATTTREEHQATRTAQQQKRLANYRRVKRALRYEPDPLPRASSKKDSPAQKLVREFYQNKRERVRGTDEVVDATTKLPVVIPGTFIKAGEVEVSDFDLLAGGAAAGAKIGGKALVKSAGSLLKKAPKPKVTKAGQTSVSRGKVVAKSKNARGPKPASKTKASTPSKPRQAAQKASQRVSRAKGKAKASPTGQAASKVAKSKPARTTAKVAKTTGKVGKAVGRQAIRPRTVIGGPFAAQIPAVLATGDTGEFQKALSGEGAFAKAVKGGASAVSNLAPGGVPRNAVRDALSLPADILPAAYFGGKAANEGLKGNLSAHKGGSEGAMKEGEEQTLGDLFYDYKKHGFLPKVVSGDIEGAAEAFKDHPVYSGLEVSGAYAGLGRGAGVAARRAPSKKVREAGSTKREDRKHYGDVNEKRSYSKNLITKGIQVKREKARAKRGEDPHQATPKQTKKHLRKAYDDMEGALEGRRRAARDEAIHEVARANPSKGRLGRTVNEGDADVVSEAAQGLITRSTWKDDIDLRLAQLKNPGHRPTRQEDHARSAQIKALERARDLPPERIDGIMQAARVYGDRMHEIGKELVDAGILTKEQARKAAAIPYAVTHMKAKYEEGVGIVDAKGNPLPLAAIRKHMAENGVERPPAFLTHRPGWRGKGSYYAPHTERAGPGDKVRTGAATLKGTYDSSYDALVEQVASATTRSQRASAFDDIMGRFAVRPKGGYFKSVEQGRDAVRNPERYGLDRATMDQTELVPVRLTAPGKTKRETDAAKRRADIDEIPEDALEALDPSSDPEILFNRLIDERVERAAVGDGPVVLVPKQVVDRMREHARGAGSAMRALQALNSTFKGTVLPLSPKWIYGNAIEPFMRSALYGINPVDYAAGLRFIKQAKKEMSPKEFRDFEQRVLGGTLFGAFNKQRIHRDASQFQGTRVEGVAKALAAVGNAPGVRSVTNLYRAYRDFMFSNNARLFERGPQTAGLGRAARTQAQELGSSWRKSLFLGEKALSDAAKGLKGTDAQLAFADSVSQVYGNWYRFSPGERQVMSTVAPFYSWARASASMVFYTLPRHHPIKTALATALIEATEQERRQLGLSNMGKPLPPNLQGSLPGGDVPGSEEGGVVPVPSLTSFGTWSDPVGNAASFAIPQAKSILNALQGNDWKGDPILRDDKPLTGEERALEAVFTFGEAFFPPAALWDRASRAGSPEGYFSPTTPLDKGLSKYLRTTRPADFRVPLPEGESKPKKVRRTPSSSWP